MKHGMKHGIVHGMKHGIVRPLDRKNSSPCYLQFPLHSSFDLFACSIFGPSKRNCSDSLAILQGVSTIDWLKVELFSDVSRCSAGYFSCRVHHTCTDDFAFTVEKSSRLPACHTAGSVSPVHDNTLLGLFPQYTITHCWACFPSTL